MLCAVKSASVTGISGCAVTVEVHIGPGLPSFTILGRPDDVCRESRERIRAAILSSGLSWPTRRITMNLSPSTHKKMGSSLDLAMAIAVLIVDEQLPAHCARGYAFLGELALDGSIRSVAGVLPMVMALRDDARIHNREHSHRELSHRDSTDDVTSCVVVPSANRTEAAIVGSIGVECAHSLAQVIGVLSGEHAWPVIDGAEMCSPRASVPSGSDVDLADVRGQSTARLGLELAAAGGHHLLLVGAPGSGKTMLARRLPGILPELDDDTALDATLVRSAHGHVLEGLVRDPPFRMPHHTSTTVSIVGGGSSSMRPGEVSLAHGGVLFLDELGEFAPSTLDGLRQPLEDGLVHLARAHVRTTLPARFILVGATNPCPCGGGGPGSCECDETALSRYRRRFSGPLMDRFDVRVLVNRPAVDDILGFEPAESTAVVRDRVIATRAIARHRQGYLNGRLAGDDLERFAPLDDAARVVLRRELEQGRLTGRGLHRIRRVARTLADRCGDEGPIGEEWVVTALALRARVAPSRVREAQR